MFCPKCNTKALDGTEFCQKCGTRLTVDNVEQKQAKASVQQVHAQPGNAPTDTPKKKKSKKLPIILGVVVLIVVAFLAINLDNLVERGEQAKKDEEYIARQQSSAVNLSETYTNEQEQILFSLAISSDEIKVFNEWASKRPLERNYHLDLISYDISSSNAEQILFNGIPVDTFFNSPAADIAAALGLTDGEDRNDDIRVYISETGYVTSAEIWNVSALTMNGTGLDMNRDGLVTVFGEPSDEGYDSGYFMTYHFPDYSMYFELGEIDSAAWRVAIFSE